MRNTYLSYSFRDFIPRLLLVLLIIAGVQQTSIAQDFTPADYTIAFVTNDNRDSVQVEWLEDLGYTVNKWWPTDVSAVNQAEINALENADLVILGRSPGSGDMGTLKDVLHAVTTPMMNNNIWGSRNNRMMWFDSGTTAHEGDSGAVKNIHIKMPEDPVFADVTLTAEDSLGLFVGPHDFLYISDSALAASNAEVVASNDDLVAIARFQPDVEFYPGSVDMPAGHRTYFGFGNDAEGYAHFFPLTDDGKKVYAAELQRLIEMSGFDLSGYSIAFVTDDNRDSVQIEWLEEKGFTVNTWWPASLSAVTQEEIDALNGSDLVILGRSGSSGDMGSMKDVFHDVWMPMMNNNIWGSRSGNMKWFASTTTGHENDSGAVKSIHIKMPDPVFAGVTLTEEDSLPMFVGPHDFLYIGDSTLAASNAIVLASNDDLVAFVRFEPGIEFYPGSIDKPVGHRTYFGFGNDDMDFNGMDYIHYFPLTEEGKSVYYAEIERLIGLGDSGLRPGAPASDDATLASITVNDVQLAAFTPATTSYVVTVPSGTTSVPTVTATPASPNASVEITDAADLSGTTTILVTAEDGTTTMTYTLSFEVDGGPVEGWKWIAVIGNGADEAPNPYDQVLIDSLKEYANVIYLNSATFNNASADSLYTTLGIEGIVVSESIGSGDLTNFGSTRDGFPVPSISFEAGTYTTAWIDDFMSDPSNAIWGFDPATEADLQWVIKDNLHPVIQPLGYELNETIIYSDQDPAARGVPYLHGFETTVNVIAVAGRQDGGTNTEFVQDLAVAVAEFPIQKSFFMNIARAHHDPGMATQDFFDMLRQAAIYMFDIDPNGGGTVSVKDVIESSVNVYPNPVHDLMTIDFKANKNQEALISLVNLSGQKVRTVHHSAKPGANQLSMKLENLAAGLYTLRIEVDGESLLSKVLIK